jgi:myo-inositol-1(or 4)-monophosphatase
MQCNEKRVRATATKKLDQALVAINGYKLTDELFTSLTEQKTEVRVNGCTLLDLIHAASGRLDAALCSELNEFDQQVASLMAQESGALTGETNGKPISSKSTSMLVANPKLFKAIVQAL